jgi:hypothetical protein
MTDIRLEWYPKLGYGYDPTEVADPYGQAYWDRYASYRSSPIAAVLMQARTDLVRRFHGDGWLVDVGIGSGHFLETRGAGTFGYDVNPIAIRWLLDRDLWWDPYARDPEAVTLWDVLEHMKRPENLLSCVKRLAFVSIPIFENRDHALRSKHYKPGEHLFYFSRDGLLKWAGKQGFRMALENRMESDLGREGIATFVFERVR